ncbi:MAG: FAD:protein FMN transferase [Candidatus Aegiribacteria sp.]|nr:FAD:protein FMN transferase [Candidatus Aegiribacteria sp.]
MKSVRKKINSGYLLTILLGSLASAVLIRVFVAGSDKFLEMKNRTPVLGTFATYIVIAEKDTAGLILSSMDSLARYLDNELGVFGNGELSDLNMRGYALIPELSSDLFNLLEKSLFISSITDSLFDPAMGVLVNTWGFPGDPHLPDSADIDSALDLSGLENVRICGDTLLLSSGTLLDFGAIAKGYTADRIYSHSRSLGARAALVEIGGEIRCGGDPDTGRLWRLAVRNPRGDNIMEMIEIESGAVATSGDYESYFFDDGIRFCHILDPRTGYPESGVASVTVINGNAAFCDALATAISVGGIDTAENIPDSLFSLIIVITEDENGEITQWRRGSV